MICDTHVGLGLSLDENSLCRMLVFLPAPDPRGFNLICRDQWETVKTQRLRGGDKGGRGTELRRDLMLYFKCIPSRDTMFDALLICSDDVIVHSWMDSE